MIGAVSSPATSGAEINSVTEVLRELKVALAKHEAVRSDEIVQVRAWMTELTIWLTVYVFASRNK